MKDRIRPVELIATFFFAVSILLIVGHEHMPCVLTNGSMSEGKYLVDCGRYGTVEVSPVYWWCSAVVQALAAISVCTAIIIRVMNKRRESSEQSGGEVRVYRLLRAELSAQSFGDRRM